MVALKEASLLTAGGRISCPRCQAVSKRHGRQCGAPAIRGQRVCRNHGGKSTGAKTAAGRQRCADAKLVHGRETRAKRQYSSEMSRLLKLYAKILGIPYRLETLK